MSNLFSPILNMSMTGSIVILFVILARLILKRSPKIFSYALWSVVLFRLLCPVAFTAPVSVLEMAEPEIQEASNNTSTVSYLPDNPDLRVDFVAVPVESQLVQQEETQKSTEQLRMTPMHAAALVWVLGAAGLMIYSIVQYLLLKRKLIGSMPLHGNVFLADNIDTAFVIGLLQPAIYMPSNVPQQERTYILAHEQHHIRRLDHVIKLLAYLALCIHWFNPLVWIAFVLAGKDMEMSCDEAVIKKLGADIRADYSVSLLRLATHKRILSGMPLAFGEGDTKGRILNMAKWKRPAKWLVAVCVILCICVVAVCAFNPEEKLEEKTIEELTRHTSDGPVSTGIGDLYFTYPGGLTSEQRDVDNWGEEDRLRSLRDLPTRRPYNNFFIDNGMDFGGVVDFIVPEDREIRLEEMNLPTEWVGLDYIGGSSSYPYAEMEYTLIKDGKDYIQIYLYTYSGRGYFLWFYTEQGDPIHKEAILNSVNLGGNGGKTKTKLKSDEECSLGLFNIMVPKGYGYHSYKTELLEITKQDLFMNQMILASVTAIPNPNLPMKSDEDLTRWLEAVGIDLDGEALSYSIDADPAFGEVSLRQQEVQNGKTVLEHIHYFFMAGDIVYDLWIDQLHMDDKTENAILDSVWLKESKTIPADNNWVPKAGESPVQTELLLSEMEEDGDTNPETSELGITNIELVSYGNLRMVVPEEFESREEDDAVILSRDGVDWGGITSWDHPGFKPTDIIELLKEDYGVPIGYMSSSSLYGDMEIELFQDGNPEALNELHVFFYDDACIYDVWYDQNLISDVEAEKYLKTVQINESAGTVSLPAEEAAFEKCSAILTAVQNGSHWLSCVRSNEGKAVLGRGTMIDYLRNRENWLTIQTQPEGGYNGTTVYKKAGFLHYNGTYYDNELVDGISGAMDEHGNVQWAKSTATEVYIPWLASFRWTEDAVSYMDTLQDEAGECIMYRIDQKYFDGDNQTEHYFVNFRFDPEGNFICVEIQVNPFQDNAFTEAESIVSMDSEAVFAEIYKEYQSAVK